MKDDVGNFSKEMETVKNHLNETTAYECFFSCSVRPACTWGKGRERSRCEVTGPKSTLGRDSGFSPERSTDWGGEACCPEGWWPECGYSGSRLLATGRWCCAVTCSVHLKQHVCDCHPNEGPCDLPLLEENQNHKDSVLKRATCDFRNSDSASVSKASRWKLHP